MTNFEKFVIPYMKPVDMSQEASHNPRTGIARRSRADHTENARFLILDLGPKESYGDRLLLRQSHVPRTAARAVP